MSGTAPAIAAAAPAGWHRFRAAGRFAARRILSAVPTALLILALGFLVTRLAPGDPVLLLVGENAPPDAIVETRARLGLDRPLLVQFVLYLGSILHGDFGFSFLQGEPVLDLILERVPATLLLVGAAVLLALVLGVTLALLAVAWVGRLPDALLSALSMVGYSVPVFWLAQIMGYVFAVKLDLFPTGGMADFRTPSEGIGRLLDIGHHLALPAFNLGLVYTALIARLTRAEMVEILNQDHVVAARAKGLPAWLVLRRHVLRLALGPLLTMTGMLLGTIFAGAIFTETIFSWPGLGRLLYDALFSRDYPVITAMFLLTSLTLVVVNAVVDLLYGILDPRIRVG